MGPSQEPIFNPESMLRRMGCSTRVYDAIETTTVRNRRTAHRLKPELCIEVPLKTIQIGKCQR